jgi:hypothetical protein
MSIVYDPATITLRWTVEPPDLVSSFGPLYQWDDALYYRRFEYLRGEMHITSGPGFHFQPVSNWAKHSSEEASLYLIPKLFDNTHQEILVIE